MADQSSSRKPLFSPRQSHPKPTSALWSPPIEGLPGPPHPVRSAVPDLDAPHRTWVPIDGLALNERYSAQTTHDTSVTTKLLEKFLDQVSRVRPAVTLKQIDTVQAIATRFPNFAEYIEWVVQSLRLSAASDMPVMLRPHLLLGEPGLGKSFVVRFLAEALDMHYDRLNLPDVSANFVISGNTSSWQNGQPGFIAQSVAQGPVPWLIMDELDKCGGADSNYPVLPTMLSLLESSTAREFRDENLQLPIDIRPLVFTFTANSLKTIDAPLLSRLHVFKIKAPEYAEMPALVRSIDAEIRESDARIARLFLPIGNKVDKVFPPMPARAVQQILLDSYAETVVDIPARAPITLCPDNVRYHLGHYQEKQRSKQKIGFHAE